MFARRESYWWLEAGLASLLGIAALAIDAINNQPWPAIALDLGACLAAALTALWPRTAGTVLVGVLTLYLVIPPGWATMGEYAALIATLGAGRRSRPSVREATVATYYDLLLVLPYYSILLAIAWREAPSPGNAMLAWVAWTVLIAIAWGVGTAFRRRDDENERRRIASLVRQRNRVAREIHDTTARSLFNLVVTARRLKRQGAASPEELDQLVALAQSSVSDLRCTMALLRDESPDALLVVVRTALSEALEAAVADLAQRGFSVATAVEGDLSTISSQASLTLGAATNEAVANILQHGDPQTPCAIIVSITADEVAITFRNGRRDSSAPSTERFGVWGMTQRLQEAGGQLAVEATPEHWVIQLTLPHRGRPDSRPDRSTT